MQPGAGEYQVIGPVTFPASLTSTATDSGPSEDLLAIGAGGSSALRAGYSLGLPAPGSVTARCCQIPWLGEALRFLLHDSDPPVDFPSGPVSKASR